MLKTLKCLFNRRESTGKTLFLMRVNRWMEREAYHHEMALRHRLDVRRATNHKNRAEAYRLKIWSAMYVD